MVARGDLGVEIDVAQMPIEQKRIIAACHRHRRPVIIATQMLDSMHDSPRPTRAEATDVANAILDGADACMLSGETAVGKYPREAVEMMNRIALATESSFQGRLPRVAGRHRRRSCTTSRGRSCVRPGRWRTIWMRSWCSWPAIRAARRLALSQHRSYRADGGRQLERSDAAADVLVLGRAAAARRAGARHAGAHQARRRLGLPHRATPRRATAW